MHRGVSGDPRGLAFKPLLNFSERNKEKEIVRKEKKIKGCIIQGILLSECGSYKEGTECTAGPRDEQQPFTW